MLWEANSGKFLRAFIDNNIRTTKPKAHSEIIMVCDFTPDGRSLVSASLDCTIKIWDIATGKLLKTFLGHRDPIEDCRIRADGRIMVSVDCNRVKLWRLDRLYTPIQQKGIIHCCKYSPDGKLIATGHNNWKVYLWDAKTLKLRQELIGNVSGVLCCDFSPQGDRIISNGTRGLSFYMWDVHTSKILKTFGPHEDVLRSVVF